LVKLERSNSEEPKDEKNVNMVAERFIFVRINREIYNKIKSENADMSNEK